MTATRWPRAFVAIGVVWFACWQLGVLVGVGRSTAIVAALYGFVFHVVFGKAYALVPSYFDRTLAVPRAPAIQLPFTVVGTVVLFVSTVDSGIGGQAETVGTVLWALGVLVFLGAIGWTIRDNVLGAETGTGGVNRDRRDVDRLANGFVPVALGYLAVSAALSLVGVGGPARTHLLAAGTAALLIFALGFRLLPRFLVVSPTRLAPLVVLVAGAVAPALLAVDFAGGVLFRVGGLLQSVAVVGFAVAFADMYRRSDRRRIGFPIVLVGALAGVAAVTIGLHLAFVGLDPRLVDAHVRLASLGFLGLVVVGVSYQFYPPSIGPGDRIAGAVVGLLLAGLAVETVGILGGASTATTAGRALAALGGVGYAAVILSLFLGEHV